MENNKKKETMVTAESASQELKEMAPPMSTKEWFITLLILMIPIVNIIMLIIWALSKNENPNKVNFAQAHLIWIGLSLVLSTLLFILFFGMMAASFNAI